MADSSPSSTDGTDDAPPSGTTSDGADADGAATPDDVDTLRRQVEEKYDFYRENIDGV